MSYLKKEWRTEQRPYFPSPFDEPRSTTVVKCGDETVVDNVDKDVAEHIVGLHNKYCRSQAFTSVCVG